MRPFSIILTAVTALGLQAAINTDTALFFSGPIASEVKLPANQVYPAGKRFPFSFYSVGGGSSVRRGELLPEKERLADRDYIMKAPVTMIGPQYELNKIILQDARQKDVQAIYSITPELNGKPVTRHYFLQLEKTGQKMNAAAIAESIAGQVRAVAADRSIAWWDVTPEELRYWCPEEVAYLKLAYETIRANDPYKRPIFMYEPGHRDAASLARLLPYQDLCIKGTYTNYSGMKENRIWVRHSLEQQVQAVALSGRKDIQPVALCEMFQQPNKEELKDIPNWVRHDVYLSLISGAKGMLVFSASKRPNFAARQSYLDAYLKTATELNGPMKLGQVFLFGKRCNDLSLSIIEGPKELSLKLRRKTPEYPSVSFGCYSYDGARYVFLVNSSKSPIKAIVSGLVYGSGVTVKSLFDDTNSFTAPEGDFDVELQPLEVAAFKVYNQTK